MLTTSAASREPGLAIHRRRDPLNARTHWRAGAVLGAASLLLLAACSGGAGSSTGPSGTAVAGSQVACVAGSITVGGSTALQPLVEQAAQQYQAACSSATVNVQGGGSGTGLTQVAGGGFAIGDSDVTAASKLDAATAATLVDHVVVRQGWIMVNNQDVTGVTNLTTDQAKAIWTGQITNWRDVGGPDLKITLIIRPESSGTRATFKQIVLGGAAEATGTVTQDSNGAVTNAVISTPGATSVIGFAYYQDNKDKLVGLQLDGVDATLQDMSNGTYKLAADGHMYTKGEASGLTQAFLDYMLSPAVQGTIVPQLYYAPVTP
jgi:phosphate transport system substrate-binding protein